MGRTNHVWERKRLERRAIESDSLVREPHVVGSQTSSALQFQGMKTGVSTSNAKYNQRPTANEYRERMLKSSPEGGLKDPQTEWLHYDIGTKGVRAPKGGVRKGALDGDGPVSYLSSRSKSQGVAAAWRGESRSESKCAHRKKGASSE